MDEEYDYQYRAFFDYDYYFADDEVRDDGRYYDDLDDYGDHGAYSMEEYDGESWSERIIYTS